MSDPLSSPIGHVLFVDDDPDVLKAASLLLGRHGLRVSEARGPAEAWSVLAAEPVDAILLDLNFQRGSTAGEEGFRCLAEIIARDPDAAVVVVTGHSGINIAVAAMRAGASDFVMKPWSNAKLVATIEAALEARRRRREGSKVATTAAQEEPSDIDAPLLGESLAIRRVRDLIGRVAPTDAPVLIHGEAGTGKSLIARVLHRRSARAAGPFAPVDLGALSAEEAATVLFGDGTGAGGAFAEARGGTLFLDEVGGLAPRLQRRVVEALEAGARANIRMISATRRPREALRGPGGLSDDLLYRLNTVEIVVPPLRDRGGDALLLAEHFLRLSARRHGRPLKPLSAEAADTIADHAWPGGVRALAQAMERCVIFAEGDRYEPADLAIAEQAAGSGSAARSTLNLIESERALVSTALKRNNFNVSHAAKELGLTRAALYRRMAKHGL
jgi:DNA-binding NtrC family response regulator